MSCFFFIVVHRSRGRPKGENTSKTTGRREEGANTSKTTEKREYLEVDKNARIPEDDEKLNARIPFLSNFVRVSGWPLKNFKEILKNFKES